MQNRQQNPCTVDDIRKYVKSCIRRMNRVIQDVPDGSQTMYRAAHKRDAFEDVLLFIDRNLEAVHDATPRPASEHPKAYDVSKYEVLSMVMHVTSQLIPLCRYEGFGPGDAVYRLGENGYVREAEWDIAFQRYPDWAPDAYLLAENGVSYGEIAEALGGGRLDEAVAALFDGSHDLGVFRTTADEYGGV